jgi:hypothetical protein
MCDEEIDFMVLSTQISNLVDLERKINPVKYSLKMFIMMTLYNFIDLLKTSDLEHKDELSHNLLTETNQVFDILLMEGSINPLFDEEPQEIKEYSQEISQIVFRNTF